MVLNRVNFIEIFVLGSGTQEPTIPETTSKDISSKATTRKDVTRQKTTLEEVKTQTTTLQQTNSLETTFQQTTLETLATATSSSPTSSIKIEL